MRCVIFSCKWNFILVIFCLFLDSCTSLNSYVVPPLAQALPGMLENLENKIASPADLVAKSTRYRVAVGNFVYQDSQLASPFSQYLARQISQAISQCSVFELCSRRELDQTLADMQVSLSALVDTEAQDRPFKPKGIEGILTGTFAVVADKKAVKLSLTLVDMEKNTHWQVAKEIEPASIPVGISVAPVDMERTRKMLQILNTDKRAGFGVKVWVDRGHSGVYSKGEKVTAWVQADKDCYVKVYSLAASGKLQLIFPESSETKLIKGGVYKIQEGKIGPPYGSEILIAIASETAFKDSEPLYQSYPIETIEQLYARLGKGKNRDASWDTHGSDMAEDICVYTSIDGNEGK